MRVLWIATKPPWPPEDGGRLLAWHGMRGLAARGHELVLVAPELDSPGDPSAMDELAVVCRPELVAASLRPRAVAGVASLVRRTPITITRHSHTPVVERARRLATAEPFDLVHAEQLQAIPAALPAAVAARLPLVLRAQNVESDLWRQAGRPGAGVWLAWEARRLERWEGRAVAAADRTLALCERDRARLADLSAAPERIDVVPAPFPASLEPAPAPLEGDPAVVLLAAEGWPPNVQGARWFLREAWPVVTEHLPDAVLHWFGGPESVAADRVRSHPAPRSSGEAFARGATFVVPLLIASGIRMKILEAWARGLPVVATPAAADGLEAVAGRELLIAANGQDFALAIVRVAREPGLSGHLRAAGRELLAARHAPRECAEQLEARYAQAISEAVGRDRRRSL